MNKYERVKELFTENANPEKAVKMAAYMKSKFNFYGIQAPERKKLYKDIISADKKNHYIDWDFLNMCYADEHREFQYLVMDYLISMQKFLAYEDVPGIFNYIKSKQWWDTIDGFDGIIGDIGLTDKRIDDLMLKWSTDDDFWLRRIAIDHQLMRKEKTNTELLAQIIISNLGSNEFFINKAIGWSLREYSKTNPDWVRDFIEKHKDKMSNLSIREGSKKLTSKK